MSLKGVFGMESSSDYWRNIRTAYAKYKNSSPKEVESIQYVVDGLNHLREWIFNESDGDERTQAEQFCKKLSKNEAYNTINDISRRAKHFNATAPKVTPKYKNGSVMADWGVLARVETLGQGSPVDFYVGDENITTIVDDVMLEYGRWFDGTNH